jgi:hypothetical protein
MKEGYLILSQGGFGDFGTCSLVSQEIWNILIGEAEVIDLTEEILNELGGDIIENTELSNDDLKNEIIENLEISLSSFQEAHMFISDLSYKTITSKHIMYFDDIGIMANHVRINDIEILGSTFE